MNDNERPATQMELLARGYAAAMRDGRLGDAVLCVELIEAECDMAHTAIRRKQRPNVTRAGVSMPPDMARMYDETIAKLHLMPVPTQDERADEISERIEARRGE